MYLHLRQIAVPLPQSLHLAVHSSNDARDHIMSDIGIASNTGWARTRRKAVEREAYWDSIVALQNHIQPPNLIMLESEIFGENKK